MMNYAYSPRSSFFILHSSFAPALAVLLGCGLGILVAMGSPAVALALAAGLAVGLAVTASPTAALLALVAVASLLPFGVIPIQFGVQLTVADALLGALLLGWLARVPYGRARLELTAPGRPLLLYIVVAGLALLAGAIYVPLSGPVVRSFVKYACAILLMLAVVNVVQTRAQLVALTRALVLCGALAAMIGLVVQSLPQQTIVDLLSSLSVVGYPSGLDVLRFRPGPNNTYTDVLRATGTSIDPNVFGGLLMLAAALTVGQLLSSSPVLPRPALVSFAAVDVAAMVATYSRGAWVGLAVALAFMATFRYRPLWVALIAAALMLAYLPMGRDMLGHLMAGLAAADRATALRLDEYRQALRLIGEYPVLGVGFGGAPEVGSFVGVSSIYLLVGEQTGLVGLGLYLATLATLLVGSFRASAAAPAEDRGLIASLQAALVAALTAGFFDHYFMNPQFPHMVALFWLYAGLLVVAARRTAGNVGQAT